MTDMEITWTVRPTIRGRLISLATEVSLRITIWLLKQLSKEGNFKVRL